MPDKHEKSVAELVFDVSERTSTLIREEVELAKAEVTEKVTKLLRGSAVGVAAGVFAFLALILIMHGIAWLLNEELFDNFWAGFFLEAAIFLLIAAGRRLVRLQVAQGRLAAGARAGDRRGEEDQRDDRRRGHPAGRDDADADHGPADAAARLRADHALAAHRRPTTPAPPAAEPTTPPTSGPTPPEDGR